MIARQPLPRRKRILIVEDEPDSSALLANFLAPQYDVVIARDGVEGIAEAKREVPDLIITDVSMPRLDGLSMVRHLRTREGLRAPVIFVTAMGTPSDVIAGISAGARNYLMKPIELADLKKRVARALG
jgi:two-component system, OmpR family, response regulator TrcR